MSSAHSAVLGKDVTSGSIGSDKIDSATGICQNLIQNQMLGRTYCVLPMLQLSVTDKIQGQCLWLNPLVFNRNEDCFRC